MDHCFTGSWSTTLSPPQSFYFNQLQVTLIGGLRNSYNVASIAIFTCSLISICTVHYFRINRNSSDNFEETENLDNSVDLKDVLIDDLKLGMVFPNKDTALKAIRHWCDANFCPLAKVRFFKV